MPEDIKVAETHEYARILGDNRVRIGITDFAATQLGDIVFVDVPEIGDTIEKGESFGSIESVKAQSDLYAPVSGEVIALNSMLEDSPELINDDSYDAGWIIEVEITNAAELDTLQTGENYLDLVESQ
ncbi:MAG: glycine cleavage system protein GcvH [Cyanobacteria bacterium P01_H01_bin.74]